MAPRLVLDCDPGHDDVVAIALAGRLADLVAVTTVAGNGPLDETTELARRVTAALGLLVPVHPGATGPPGAPIAERRHDPLPVGAFSNLGPLGSTGAVEAMVEAVRAVAGTWVVATGPLTNVAAALSTAPDLVDQLGGLSLMGGRVGAGPPEFNLATDPRAASTVLAALCRRVLCPIDVTLGVRADAGTVAQLRALGSPAARLVADALDASADRHAQAGDPDGAPLHDPCALLCVTHPHLFSTEPAEVRISPDGTLDVAPSAAGDEGAVQVVRGADPARILDVVMTVCGS
jgi:inosine-uridine nucleoside N-ribohydrolase